MIQVSYETLGVVAIILLACGWLISAIRRRKNSRSIGWQEKTVPGISSMHEIEHRALMFLMAQKTDAILAALSHTIDQERQKLGAVVRNPSMDEALVAFQAKMMAADRPGDPAREATTAAAESSPAAASFVESTLPPATTSHDAPQPRTTVRETPADNSGSPYDQVIRLADDGVAVGDIASQLRLPEAEVSMVIRLHAA